MQTDQSKEREINCYRNEKIETRYDPNCGYIFYIFSIFFMEHKNQNEKINLNFSDCWFSFLRGKIRTNTI